MNYMKLARDIRRKHLPWDEYHYLAGPGGVSDQIEHDIASALEQAVLEALLSVHGPTEFDRANWCARLAELLPKDKQKI